MPTAPELRPAGLEHLLAALRAAGLPVGAHEILRLHHVFALAPGLDQDRPPDRQLRDLLATALTHDPAERRLFDDVYEPWAERWNSLTRQAAASTMDSALPELGEPRDAPHKTQRLQAWRTAAWLALTLLALLLTDGQRPEPIDIDRPPDKGTEGPDVTQPEPTTEQKPIHTIWVPRFEVIDRGVSIWRPDWPPLGLGALALATAGLLGWRYWRKAWIPEVLPEPLPGPARLPLLPLPAGGPELLDAGGAETLIWGVDRHVTERLTTEIDLEATARETARAGGIPELRFEPEKRLREVWLWLDGTVEDPALERWAEEIAGSLDRSGLPVRIGGFDGVPAELAWDEGQSLRPIEVEAHRETALVAICTDGEVLLQQLEDAHDVALLSSLAAWQRLAVVDFSHRDGGLKQALGPLGLTVVTPEELPAFFGLGVARASEPVAVDPGEVRAWRAALALGDRPIDRPTAFAARRALGLELSPWAFHLLEDGERDDPAQPARLGGKLSWSAEGRAELVAWLAESSLTEPTGIREGGLLERALDFWQARLAAEADRRGARVAVEPWAKRPAERHLRMERAFLRLWREPRVTAEELFELGSGELSDVLRERLGKVAPRDCHRPGDGLTPLPWRLNDDLDDRSRYLLAERGLGGVRRGALTNSGRLGLGLGMLGGLAALMLIEVGIGQRESINIPPRIVLADQQPPDGKTLTTEPRPDGGQWRVGAFHADGPQYGLGVWGASVVELTWVQMRFVELDGATFRMGSEKDEPLSLGKETPAHDVTVGDFWIGQTEVTNAQYRGFKPDHPGGDDLPAVNVSWFDARSYCQSRGSSQDWEYDLPSEAEWEFAARAGTNSARSFGDDEKKLGEYAWFRENSELKARKAGAKKPNPWDLHDMHGNVWEWVLDCWDNDAYRERARDTPIPDPALAMEGVCHERNTPGTLRVLRGGAFNYESRHLRSAVRDGLEPERSSEDVGFRCVRRARRQP